ncbi:hypothetical protein PENARI_c019G02846 [Penicillium arizonense]|uniref:O-methyltransferase C-terminal domain-containing protein n=1 Tax=Penicillium arizonense TaxID=1835702 RepID=A0A1F5L9I6_PENAI|nr:hypothetical protein PENARI_c019G02846 [Penicillium arizonense]OGE49862.1 hypothetical protein PENARI_c019G02846 [Penicillium arizonense]
MSSSTLESLASTVYAKAKELAELTKEHGVGPSIESPGGSDLSTIAPLKTRNELIRAAKDLIYLAMGPTDHVLSPAWSAGDYANLDLLTRFQIPQLVPLDSSISMSDLSAAASLPEDVLARGIRYGVANGLFREIALDQIAHSSASAELHNNGHLRNVVHFGVQFLQKILMSIPSVMVVKEDKSTDKVPESAFNLAYNTEENLFEYFAHSKDLNTKCHEYLIGRVNTPLWSMDRLRAAWDWVSLGPKTIVDIGRSSGHTVLAIAPLASEAEFIVQGNNVDALDMGRKLVLLSAEPGVASRISFQSHNFFEPQPVSADGYILRHILHDWNDEDLVSILKALLPSIKPGARVFISEGILPDPPAQRLNTLTENMILIEDQFMLAAHDARERTVGDFVRLFHTASPKFRLVGVTSGVEAGAFQSLLEFEFQ